MEKECAEDLEKRRLIPADWEEEMDFEGLKGLSEKTCLVIRPMVSV